MAETWETNYLALIAEVIGQSSEENGMLEVLMTEQGGRPVLTLVPDLPDDGFEDVELRITVEHILEGTDQLQIMVSMFDGVPEALLADAERVAARINEFMILGSTAIFYEAGLIFYSHAFVIDREMSVEAVTSLLGATLRIIVKTVPQIMDILAPLLDGSVTADALIAQGIDLVQ